MRIPNMCLVLKLDNGKVVSIVNKQTHPVDTTKKYALLQLKNYMYIVYINIYANILFFIIISILY